jgi:chromosomal replication initiation ATPase DnaA
MKQLSLPISSEPRDCCEFLVSKCNEEAYKMLIEQFSTSSRTILSGPKMSGKTRLAKLWCSDGLYLDCKYDDLDFTNLGKLSQFVIDNYHLGNEVELFHIINRCGEYGIDLLLVSSEKCNFKLPDLVSRLNGSFPLLIFEPDCDFCFLVIQELTIINKIKVKNSTLDYIKQNIKFDNYCDLWKFRSELKAACDENRNVLDMETFKRIYDNRSGL